MHNTTNYNYIYWGAGSMLALIWRLSIHIVMLALYKETPAMLVNKVCLLWDSEGHAPQENSEGHSRVRTCALLLR